MKSLSSLRTSERTVSLRTSQMNNATFSDVLDNPDRWLSDHQRRWLGPRGFIARLTYSALYLVNWILVRALFRLSVEGSENLPVVRPYILTPNHASVFDPPILAAALPLGMLQETLWAGKRSTVMRTRLRRVLSWLTRVIPIESEISAIASGISTLEQNRNLVWFPEGRRSLDGRLQKFRPGIAWLLSRCDVQVVPICVIGAYEAFPNGALLPRLRAGIVVRIGEPHTREQLGMTTRTDEVVPVVSALRQCVVNLQEHKNDSSNTDD